MVSHFGSRWSSGCWLTAVDDLGGMVPWSGSVNADQLRSYASPCVGFRWQPSSYLRLEVYGFVGLSEGA